MRVNLLITMIIFALIWPVTALRAAVSKTTWADAPAREFVFVENNSDDNFFVTPGGALDPRLTGANRWTGLKYTGSGCTGKIPDFIGKDSGRFIICRNTRPK